MSNYTLYRGVDERDNSLTYFIVEDTTGRCACFGGIRTLDGAQVEGEQLSTVVGEVVKDPTIMNMLFENSPATIELFSDVKLVQQYSGALQ